MFKWLLNLFSTYSKYEEKHRLPFDEILKRYEVWSARRASYIEQSKQRLNRGECTWDDFTSGIADIDEKILSEPASCAEINAMVNDLCLAYLDATPNTRTQIHNFATKRWPLFILIQRLPEKMATEMMSPRDVDKLLCGLAAISIVGGRSDYRENLALLADLFVRAEQAGIRPKPYFQAVAKVSSGQVLFEGDTPLAEMLSNFHRYAIVKSRRIYGPSPKTDFDPDWEHGPIA